MSAPQRKQSVFEGARRPWNTGADGEINAVHIKLAPNMEEVNQCLSCNKHQHYCDTVCSYKGPPVTKRKWGGPPDGFQKKFLAGIRSDDLAALFGVHSSTINEWARKLGLKRPTPPPAPRRKRRR